MPRKVPLSEMTRNQLRSEYYSLVKSHQSIPDNLNQYLTDNFPTYDPEKHIFTGPNIRIRVKKPVRQMSRETARSMYYDYTTRKKPVPDDLNEYLGELFPTYDPIKRVFIGKAGRIIPISKMTPEQLKHKFFRLQKNKEPIPNNLNKRLAQAYITYDPVQRKFTGARDRSRENYPLHDKNPTQLRNRYRYLQSRGEQIPDNLNDRLAELYETYDRNQRVFLTDIDLSQKTIIRKPKLNRIKTPNYYVLTKNPQEINSVQYWDISINNHCILVKNAPRPTFQAIMDNTILAVHTVETEQYPARWILFDLEMNQITSRHIRHISTTDDELRIYADSGAMITIPKQKLLENINTKKRFSIRKQRNR